MPLNEHYRGFTVPQTEEFARFNQWRAALLERPSVKDTTASVDYLIAAYRSWAI
ncbi:hypothetical protein BC828DRAFT_383078 [Blastocladiella britannica]|nr:hypothetical protein BC828DRAFT_383078 [Blastocladiella britannica]